MALAQHVQSLLRTCYITAAGQSTILAFFKPTSPQFGEENSCLLRRQCVFLPPMFSVLSTGSLFCASAACVYFVTQKRLSPTVAAVCGVWGFAVATCYIPDISCLLNHQLAEKTNSIKTPRHNSTCLFIYLPLYKPL